ncbi:MAG TPA: serine--tRNA ligase [Treponema sp.]|nr:serine--tRNA ligase [Treponema sp.]
MLDIALIRENPELVKKSMRDRQMSVENVDRLLELDKTRRELLGEAEALKAKRNSESKAIGKAKDPAERQERIAAMKVVSDRIAELDKQTKETEEELKNIISNIPNIPDERVPYGVSDAENQVVETFGVELQHDFEDKPHWDLGTNLGIIDFDRGTKVSGPKFYYLKNEAVFLEQALIMYALNTLRRHGFTTFITPDVAKEEVLKGIGFNPRGNESNVYAIEDEGTCLVATAEITLGGFHSGEILDKSKLPLFYCGLSHCFRREAGAAGHFSKGLYRVHQFDKVEMFVYCLPEQSDEIHEKLRLIEEEIFTGLGLPFRVVDTCTGDLGAPAYRKWDLEAWMPGRADEDHPDGDYGEVTSTSNCTDYQARRLNVKYHDDDGKNKYVHMLNGTAIAVGRAMLAIMENYQNADGSITIPEVLVPFCGFDKIGPRESESPVYSSSKAKK